MNLTELKSRYNGKCAKCGRELKEGWNIFYDRDNKATYCKPCGAELSNGATATMPAGIENLTEEEIELLPGSVRDKLLGAGVIKPPTLEDKIDQVLESLESTDRGIDSKAIDALAERLDIISGGVSALIACVGELADDTKTQLALLKAEKPPKQAVEKS